MKFLMTTLGGQRLADFRLDTDILIQVQKTDAMSGAMLESLYAGAKIITGAWLPYGDLRSLGVDWVEVCEIEDIKYQLPKIINKEIDIQKNREIVAGMARWSNIIPSWENCYFY